MVPDAGSRAQHGRYATSLAQLQAIGITDPVLIADILRTSAHGDVENLLRTNPVADETENNERRARAPPPPPPPPAETVAVGGEATSDARGLGGSHCEPEPAAAGADLPGRDAAAAAAGAQRAAEPAATGADPHGGAELDEAGSAGTSAAAWPAPRAKPASAGGAALDRLDLDPTQVTGNRELPKVMVIVPWKRSDLGDLAGRPVNSLIDEALQPVDRDVFRREVAYYNALAPDRPQSECADPVPSPAVGAEK